MFLFGYRKRLHDMSTALEEIAGGDVHKKLPALSRDSIDRLAYTINRLVDSLRERIVRLEQENERLRTMFSSMIEAVIAVDEHTRIISLNPAAEALFELDGHKALGRLFLESVRNNDIAELLASVLEGGAHVTREVSVSWPQQKIFRINASPIAAQGGTRGCLLVIDDVTEIRKLERMRSDFVANISHELKTPLTSIKGFVETLLEGALEDKENSREFLRIIHEHTERLNSLINDLLDLSYIESKEVRLTRGSFDLRGLVESIVTGFSARARKRGITVTISGGPQTVSADKGMVEQVLTNLIDNALKFNRDNGSIVVSIENQGRMVKVTVKDNGIGIPAKDLPRIFERFYRVDKARSREMGGTGLGLSIVKHIVELHSGTVGVESTEGSGTTFWFIIPRDDPGK
jgi:two-component system, OmpR family, phosphate regulon sensor histidine kinase PhoR